MSEKIFDQEFNAWVEEHKADLALPSEFERLIALAKMPDNARIQACAKETQAIYAKWQCQPTVLSQVVNGVVTVQPGLQALPVSITPQG